MVYAMVALDTAPIVERSHCPPPAARGETQVKQARVQTKLPLAAQFEGDLIPCGTTSDEIFYLELVLKKNFLIL